MTIQIEKNPSEFYGESYLRRSMNNDGGATRWNNNGSFYGAACFVARFLEKHKLLDAEVLDVGCGRGWVVHNLRNLGIDAVGVEYGDDAVEKSVCGSKKCDLTKKNGIPYPDDNFDFVLCNGVLSHFCSEYSDNAVSELVRVTRKFVWTNVLVDDDDIPLTAKLRALNQHHINIAPRKFWTNVFVSHGMTRMKDDDIFREYHLGEYQWSGVWIIQS